MPWVFSIVPDLFLQLISRPKGNANPPGLAAISREIFRLAESLLKTFRKSNRAGISLDRQRPVSYDPLMQK